jgi:hypothetical protein
MQTAGTVKKPLYNDLGQVYDLKSLDRDETITFSDASTAQGTQNVNVYCLEQTFYLKTEQGTSNTDIPVYLKIGTQEENNKKTTIQGLGYNTASNLSGTYVVCTGSSSDKKTKQSGDLVASTAMKFCFASSYGDAVNYGIYEPNAEVDRISTNKADTTADFKVNAIKSTVQQKSDGTFPDDYATQGHSTTLFTIRGGGVTNKIVMKVWLEGSDDQCGNEVGLDNLAAQFQFTLGGTD